MSEAYELIEFPSVGRTYTRQEFGVYRYSEYPPGSVLAGQECRSFLAAFPTLEAARAAHPAAELGEGSNFRDVRLSDIPPAWFDPEAAGERWSEDL